MGTSGGQYNATPSAPHSSKRSSSAPAAPRAYPLRAAFDSTLERPDTPTSKIHANSGSGPVLHTARCTVSPAFNRSPCRASGVCVGAAPLVSTRPNCTSTTGPSELAPVPDERSSRR